MERRKRVRRSTRSETPEHPAWRNAKQWWRDYRSFVQQNPHETLKWLTIAFVAIAMFAMWPLLPLLLVFGPYVTKRLRERGQ